MPKPRLERNEDGHATQNARPIRGTPRYAEHDRIAAVAILVAAGGLTREGITIAREMLHTNVSESTLARWLNEYRDQVIAADQSLIQQPPDIPAIVSEMRTN